MVLSVIVYCLMVFAIANCKKIQPQSVKMACENSIVNLACPDKTSIRVVTASYGRDDYITCPHLHIRTDDCSAANSLTIVQSQCDGRQLCNVRASNSLFGDPCVNTYKYLKVKYICEKNKGPSPPNKPSSQLNVCEGQRGNIQCPGNKYIKINGATYGRTDRTTCPDPRIKTTECSTDKPLSMIRDQCQGQQECTVTSSNKLYGDPCVNTYKYLTVNFDCTGKGNANKEKGNWKKGKKDD
ncbi:Hypothetical predicted protein [Mytilus galloprovincialis]|uniref:SUEL-type lectin domain-containing protein n=2 Tax=Mytilus galloprovincialis TaxID=29158 RepID=A0A8B6FKG8_MYTGA|nr:Hypothetical predicted protein [Mytilus galloprovincialis]